MDSIGGGRQRVAVQPPCRCCRSSCCWFWFVAPAAAAAAVAPSPCRSAVAATAAATAATGLDLMPPLTAWTSLLVCLCPPRVQVLTDVLDLLGKRVITPYTGEQTWR